ncbi:methyltransferase, FxLD system [Actinomadura sp. NPDC047616]|uniref:methyltransferase, FxLD system n=1 Tax=Actinomadura sp. NPDC047616 TaxID=3155914 RepID=UPI0033D326C2
MAPPEWPQRLIQFTDWPNAEMVAVEHLLPALVATHVGEELTRWSFVRKYPTWRLRHHTSDQRVSQRLDRVLDDLMSGGLIREWTPGIYEPETTAFGGTAGMDVAHTLFHHDSHHILRHLARRHTPGQRGTPSLGRRELAILLPSVAMRAARLDWYEQGDVWAKVAAQRPPEQPRAERGPLSAGRLTDAVRRLMTVDVGPSSSPITGGRLSHLAEWIAAFEQAGQQLADLNGRGRLERGLRAVLAHHLIFHWNRLGLAREDQGTLAALAKEVVMETEDNAVFPRRAGSRNTTVGAVSSNTIGTSAEHLRTALVDQLMEQGRIRTARVREAMRTVPRHVFVPHAPLEKAYANTTVDTKFDAGGAPISCASQPDIVAMMLEQAQVEPGHKVLELGAGTGYNAGLLGHLVGERGHVTTIDVDDDIVQGARAGLTSAGIDNVTVVLGDGALGYADNAPYDRIIATVGAHGVPHAWLDQLASTGRLLAPLRLRGSVSRSIAFERKDGAWRSVNSEMNTFMPLRQGIADDPRRLVPLTPDSTVTLVTNGDQTVDAEALADVLHQPRCEVWTGVTFRGPESAEWLELWLTCTMPNGLSRMPATRQAIDNGLLSAPYPSSTATFDHGALTYLTRRKATKTAPDGATLYEFGVIGHGPGGDKLAEQVADAVRTWDGEYRGRQAEFELQPLDSESPKSRPGRFAFDNALNRIIIEWR